MAIVPLALGFGSVAHGPPLRSKEWMVPGAPIHFGYEVPEQNSYPKHSMGLPYAIDAAPLTPKTTPTDRHIWQSHGVFGYHSSTLLHKEVPEQFCPRKSARTTPRLAARPVC